MAEELVYILDLRAGAGGDALAASAADDFVVAALLGGHRVDDGLQARELLLIDVAGGLLHAGKGADGREHFQDALHGTHLLDLA